ncbi:MAG: 50S ribosomal protein L6 [Bacilli bacterium]|nr:50S ribosomal protein L6 [Bacilli bacterium]
MSRIGNRILTVPEGVEVSIQDSIVTVKGALGELSCDVSNYITVEVADNQITVKRINETKIAKQMHGTANANIANMIEGVTKGYVKGLEILGVGYRFQPKGDKLVINAGYSHPVELEVPAGLKVEGVSNTEITVKGIDKQAVGEFAANIRKVRQPEPYKGKGIRYKGEHIRRKEGKKASK